MPAKTPMAPSSSCAPPKLNGILLPLHCTFLAVGFCLQCFDAVGWAAEGHPTCKWWGAGVVICLELGAALVPLPLTVSCSSKIQIRFNFLVPAHLGSPG